MTRILAALAGLVTTATAALAQHPGNLPTREDTMTSGDPGSIIGGILFVVVAFVVTVAYMVWKDNR